MQKLKLQNTWNNETKSFDKNNFDLKESEKAFSGRVVISTLLKPENKWLNKSVPFIAFKSSIDNDTIFALRNSREKTFEADIGLMLYQGKEGVDVKIVINKARLEIKEVDKHSMAKADAYINEEDDSYLPF